MMLSMEEDKKSFKVARKERKRKKIGRNWRRVGGLE